MKADPHWLSRWMKNRRSHFCFEAVDWKNSFAPCDFASLVGLVEGRCIRFCGRGTGHKWAVHRRLNMWTCRSQQMQVRAWRSITDSLSHINHYSQRTFFLRHSLHAFGVRLEQISAIACVTRGERGEAIRRSLTYLRTQSSESGELSRFSVAATMALPGSGSTNKRCKGMAR